MTLSVHVEVEGWTTIGTAIIEAVEIAKKLEASVVFDFNGERVIVHAKTDPEAERQRYVAAIDARRCGICGALMAPGATNENPKFHATPKGKQLCMGVNR